MDAGGLREKKAAAGQPRLGNRRVSTGEAKAPDVTADAYSGSKRNWRNEPVRGVRRNTTARGKNCGENSRSGRGDRWIDG